MNSKMTNCKVCNGEIAKGVSKCPHCGKDQRNFFMRHKVLSVIGILIVLCIIGVINSNGDKDTSKTTSTNSSAVGKSSSSSSTDNKKYSYDKFMTVTMGMSYDQVKGILGDGTEESSSGDGDNKTIVYTWKNSDSSNISVEIQGNAVINKAQAFLKNMDAGATMNKYNQINNGMTYEQVKEILGEGELISQTELLGSKSEMYEWINSNGSNMNVTFQDGKVDTKTQFQLK